MNPSKAMKAISLPVKAWVAGNQLRRKPMKNRLRSIVNSRRPLRVGFVPLCDCAPIVMAQELGLFSKHGLEVVLSRELGWATVRDKIIYGELDAAQATAPMVFAASLGLGSVRVPCLTGLILNLHGNAITLSNRLWEAGVRDGPGLRDFVRSTRATAQPTFGVVFRYSTHDYLLRKFLRAHGIDPERDVRIVIVPPAQMAGNLKVGNLDGFCVGEPWNSVAIVQRAGWVISTSNTIAPLHPEKVLMVRRQFAESRQGEHVNLIAALQAACFFCDQPQNRERILETLAQPHYVNTSANALRRSLCGPFELGKGREESIPDFHIFARHNANEPSLGRARWVLDGLNESGALHEVSLPKPEIAAKCFRSDIYRAAIADQVSAILPQDCDPISNPKHLVHEKSDPVVAPGRPNN
jgi:ABC-type nitrate/sulfonate/bicarbonate transport system substrate-binding protein